MKTLVIGGLGILLLFALVGVTLVYLLVVRPARDHLDALRQMTVLGALDKQILNQRRFEAPLSGELTPEMVERFTRVQQAMLDELGRRLVVLRRRSADLEAVVVPGAGDVGLEPVLRLYQGLATVLADAKRAQVEALNENGFSLEEYRWVRGQIYEAAGLLFASVDLDALRQAVMDRHDALTLRPPPGHREAPALNRELVEPYLGRFTDWLPLAWFGL